MFFSKIQKGKMWGTSDCLICCSGFNSVDNEFNAMNNPKLQWGGYVATFLLEEEGAEQGVFIHAFYSGHWSFAVSPSNIDIHELPVSWVIAREWGSINENSETLIIECPKHAKLKLVDKVSAFEFSK